MAKEKVTAIDLRSKIKVRTTAKNKHAEEGTILEVHPIIAEHGFNNGLYEIVKEGKK